MGGLLPASRMPDNAVQRQSAHPRNPRVAATSRDQKPMTPSSHPAYDQLAAAYARIHRFQHLEAIVGWDQAANMPPKGNEARAAALAELAGLLHRLRTDGELRTAMQRAA